MGVNYSIFELQKLFKCTAYRKIAISYNRILQTNKAHEHKSVSKQTRKYTTQLKGILEML